MPHPSLKSLRKAKEKGIAVYLTAIFLLVLIPVVGLSIDGGLAYVIQSRVQAAADGAALAAGRGLTFSGGVSAAQAAATTAATNYFNADFPSAYLNTLTTGRTVTPTFSVNTDSGGNPTGQITISISASVQAPTYFMRWLGIPSLSVGAGATATRKMLVMEIVLDKSSSMLQGASKRTTTGVPSSTSSTYTSCDNMVAAAAQFTTYFSPYDTVGMISFGLSVYDDNDAGNDGSYTASTNYWESGSAGIQNAIGNIDCGSNTNTTAALYEAYKDIKKVGMPQAQNVIVLFTDGVANAVNGDFPIRTMVDSRMSADTSGSGCGDLNGKTPCTTGTANAVTCPGKPGCVGSSPSAGMAVCTTTAGTVTAAIAQWAGFDTDGGTRGAANIFSTDSTPSAPAGCRSVTSTPGGSDATIFTSQTIAYIPNSDHFGNSTINLQTGISGSGSSATITTAVSPWFQWLYQVNNQCAASSVSISSGNLRCKNLGDYWTNYPTTGKGADHNTFTSGPYSGYLRPDLPNTIGTVSMTTATNQAFTIRNDTTYNPIIDVVYLQGNSGDPVDRDFLQLVSNQQYIQPVLYQDTASCASSAGAGSLYSAMDSGTCQSDGTFKNPYYVSTQQPGIWVQTADSSDLTHMFQAIASSLLRLSQ